MITFIHPYNLLWLLLAVPLVIFYLWRLRVKRHEVATGTMWQRALPLIHPRRAWQVWRWPVSLAAQLAVLVTLVLALAEPCWRRPQRVAVVLDMTSSMSVQDAGGKTRLDLAREKLHDLVKNLGYNDRISLIVVSDSIRIISRMTNDRDVITRADLPPVGGNASVAEAVGVARSIVTAAAGGLHDPKTQSLVLISDGCFPQATDILAEPDVRWIAVGSSIANVELENLAVVRRNTNEQHFQTLVTLRNHSPREIPGTLVLALDGKPFLTEKVTVPANHVDDGCLTLHAPPMAAPDRHEIRATFEPDNPADDFLPEDNRLEVTLSGACAFRVTVVTPGERNRLLEDALNLVPGVELKRLTVPEGKPTPGLKTDVTVRADGVDLIEIVLYDRVLPADFDAGALAGARVMCFAPPVQTRLWQRQPDTQDFVLMPWTEGVKYHFNTAGIGFTGTHFLAPSPEAKRLAEVWLVSQSTLEQGTKKEDENLAKSARAVSTTELAWGITPAEIDANYPSRMVLVACDLTKSDWLLADDFPQFLRYSLDWLADTDATRLRLIHGTEPAWTPPAVARDSNLNVPPPPEAEYRLPGEDVIPMWSILAVFVLAGIAVEWCFYQRRWLE